MTMTNEHGARAIADLYRREKKSLRRDLSPDETLTAAHGEAADILRAVEAAMPSPVARGFGQNALARLLPDSRKLRAVYAEQIKVAEAVIELLGHYGWRDGLSDDRQLELATRILTALRNRYPEILAGVRSTPKFLKHFIDRHGYGRWYYRRSGRKDISLPGAPGEHPFHDAYRRAHADAERGLRTRPAIEENRLAA